MAKAEAKTDGKWIGRSVRRVEDPRLLTGGGTFVDDLKMGHLHHVAILRSPYPHARILRIDTSAAAKLPGVRVVVTSPEVVATTQPFSLGVPAPLQYYCMAADKVRFVGEPVAAVVATSRYLAEDALDHIHVDYEPLPATVDPERSMDRAAATRTGPSARRTWWSRRSSASPSTGPPPSRPTPSSASTTPAPGC